MGYSDKDQILMENLYVFEGYGAKKLIKKFVNNGWGLKKLQETGMTARRKR